MLSTTEKITAGKKIRVAFVLPDFGGGGAEKVTLTLLQCLDRKIFQPELIVFAGDGPLSAMVPADIPLRDLGHTRLRHAFIHLFHELADLKADVLFSSVHHTNLALLAMRPFLPGRPRVIVRESNTPSHSLPSLNHTFALRLGYRLLYPRADRIICISQKIRDELARDFGLSPARLATLANPIDIEGIRTLAKADNLEEGKGVRFVTAGRLTPKKGYDRLLNLFSKTRPDAHLTILGDGPEEAGLRWQANQLGVAERLTLAGFVTNPWPYFAAADAFVLASHWEGMPNAALEALACGTPVIATPEAGGIGEVAREAPGAITLAEAGSAFVDAMGKVQPRTKAGIRESLLPGRFAMSEVAVSFAKLLAMQSTATD
jgi:glycosyltransferase involved in cell wall biosynthesis